MSRIKKISLIGFLSVVSILAVSYLVTGSHGVATVNNKDVTHIEFVGDIGKQYLDQYYNETHTFCKDDAVLNERFVQTNFINPEESTLQFYFGKFKKKNYTVQVLRKPNVKALKKYLIGVNKDAEKSVEPTVKLENGKYVPVAGSIGTEININGVINAVKANKVGIRLSDYTIKPTLSDKQAEELADNLNKLLAWHITYTSGQKVTINPSDIKIDYKTLIYKYSDTTDYSPLLRQLDVDYGEIGRGAKVTLHNGKKAFIKGGTWGRLTNSAKEKEFILSAIKNLKSYDNRKPIMLSGKPIGYVVEVSIGNQHVWVYNPKTRKIVMQSDCVTGTLGSHDTPKGVFRVSEMRKDYVMHGENADGSKYESHCQRFMRLTNSGVALHDASWRYAFGGSIYKYSGSHGCINLPTNFALKLFNTIKNGTMVIVH